MRTLPTCADVAALRPEPCLSVLPLFVAVRRLILEQLLLLLLLRSQGFVSAVSHLGTQGKVEKVRTADTHLLLLRWLVLPANQIRDFQHAAIGIATEKGVPQRRGIEMRHPRAPVFSSSAVLLVPSSLLKYRSPALEA